MTDTVNGYEFRLPVHLIDDSVVPDADSVVSFRTPELATL